MRKYAIAALAVTMSALPAQAQEQAPDALTCLDSGYSEAEMAAMQNYRMTFDLASMDPDEVVMDALARRAAECVDGLEMGDEALEPLIMHRFSGMVVEAIATHRPDVVDTVTRIDTLLDPEKRARFYTVFQRHALGGAANEAPISDADDEFFGNVILDPPVNGTEEQAESIGGYLAARVMRRQARDQIEALQSGD